MSSRLKWLHMICWLLLRGGWAIASSFLASQPIFHDIRGEPIRARDAFLPRQRAYFAALAESMCAESARLAQRTVLTDEQRTAVRIAVALLISSHADFVNTCVHSSIDKPHPSTSAGPLRLGGLFTEVGGFWLERFWQNRLSHLLDLLCVNSSAARPVLAIKANADAIPLGDAAVSAVIWDPPYYDNIDYDTVSRALPVRSGRGGPGHHRRAGVPASVASGRAD